MHPDEPNDDAEQARFLKQLPPEPAPVAFDIGTEDFPAINQETSYSVEPPNLRTIALMKDRYDNITDARARANEICLVTGERVHQVFETARAYVARVFLPLKPGEGYR
jgi:hypothetical protein